MTEIITAINEIENYVSPTDTYESWDGFEIVTDQQTIRLLIANGQSCCERWGYFMTEDDTAKFVGSSFTGISLTDVALNTKKLEDVLGYADEVDGVMFVNIDTTAGRLQFVAYNQHNGYYGHSARIESGGSLGLLARTGSRAYGTDHPESDHDFRGVYIASLKDYCGIKPPPRSIDVSEPHDAVLYELSHFAQLATKGNPTALETLWADEFTASAVGQHLRDHRHLFLSRNIIFSYGGYAMSQLKKARAGTGGSRGADHHKRAKFRLHTLRLLHVGQHALATGEIMVRLPDQEIELLRAQAALPLDDFVICAKHADLHLRTTAETSSLPDAPDVDAINQLLYEIRTGQV